MVTGLKNLKIAKFGLLRSPALLALTIFLAAAWLGAGSSLAGMSLMDEDSLNDVQGQTGLSLVARVRTTAGGMRITATSNTSVQSYLDFGVVTMNNSGGGFGRIGDVDDPATLDIGRNGANIRMKLQLPNGYDGANETTEIPSIQGINLLVSDSAGVATNAGTLSINRIQQDRSALTLWCHATGMNLLAELRGDIQEVSLTNHQSALVIQDTYFSATKAGTSEAPTLGTGYFNFGNSTNGMQIDIYTGTTTAATDDSIIRITYPVSGTVIFRNGRISNPNSPGRPGTQAGNELGHTATTNDYGPIIMENMSGGEVTIYLPVSAGWITWNGDY